MDTIVNEEGDSVELSCLKNKVLLIKSLSGQNP